MSVLTLYHGSPIIVAQPRPELCRPHNDYGAGFYCTCELELAKEWACQLGRDGFANAYAFDMDGLRVIDLNGEGMSILNWLAVLLEHRLCRLSSPTMQRGSSWLLEGFSVDVSAADVVTGYRADDSYFSFARAFLRNELTLGQLASAMRLGKLGVQYMVKSEKAFNRLEFLGGEFVDSSEYWPKRQHRDDAARQAYMQMVVDGVRGDDVNSLDSCYLSDLMTMDEGELHACLR